MARTPEERLAELAKREAALKRDKAAAKQAARREHDRKLRGVGAVVEEAGALDWPKEKLLAAIRNALGNGAEGELEDQPHVTSENHIHR